MTGAAKTYRSHLPYRKHGRYRGQDYTVPVQGFGFTAQIALPTELPIAGQLESAAAWKVAGQHADILASPFNGLAHLERSLELPLHDPVAHALASTLPFDGIVQHERDLTTPMHDLPPRGRDLQLPSNAIAKHEHVRSLRLHQAAPHARLAALPWGTLTAHQLSRSAIWRALVSRNAFIALPWSPIGRHETHITTTYPVEYYGVDPLVFPSQRVYVMIPTLEVVRLPERTPIPVLSADISGDGGAWAWTFSAQIPYSSLSLVNPADNTDPVDIEIKVNGWTWTFKVEAFDDNRRFGTRTATLRGRSRSAELAAPYAPKRSYTETADRTAVQLAEQELTATGWTLVWDAVNWLVPGETFTYADLAPIDAISRLAQAIGASVQSDPAAKTLHVVPGYSASPWQWPTTDPYAIVPAEVLTAGDGSWRGGQNANGVYVYAENAGYGALVKLTGTDGAEALPQIVEALAVSAVPTRERGRIELAKAGKIKDETRTIPLFPSPASPGLIPIGSLLQITDSDTEVWRGQVTTVRIAAQRSGSSASVRQILGIERQFR